MTHAPASAATADAPVLAGLSLLDELAEIGMTFARALGRIAQAAIDAAGEETPQPTPELSEAALAFSRVSRAVRMSVGLKAKILRDDQARADRLAVLQEVKDAEAAQLPAENEAKGGLRREMTRFIVSTAIEAEERDEDELETLFETIDARLEAIEAAQPYFEDVHIKTTAYAIAKDLGIDPGPDWWMDGWQIEAPRTAGVPPASSPPPMRSSGGGGPPNGGGGGRCGPPASESQREDGMTNLSAVSAPVDPSP